MLSCCANPACSAPLRYLQEGRLFQFEVRSTSLSDLERPGPAARRSQASHQVSHFWLCGRCCTNLTLTFDQVRGVMVVPLRSADQASRASQAGG